MPKGTTFGAVLKRQREESRLTQQDVAARVGVSSVHIGRLEKGERDPSVGLIKRLARVLGGDESDWYKAAGKIGFVAEVTREPNDAQVARDAAKAHAELLVSAAMDGDDEAAEKHVEMIKMLAERARGEAPRGRG